MRIRNLFLLVSGLCIACSTDETNPETPSNPEQATPQEKPLQSMKLTQGECKNDLFKQGDGALLNLEEKANVILDSKPSGLLVIKYIDAVFPCGTTVVGKVNSSDDVIEAFFQPNQLNPKYRPKCGTCKFDLEGSVDGIKSGQYKIIVHSVTPDYVGGTVDRVVFTGDVKLP